jgi:catechol 2,3-dioxygenase-like lactoylglutathione lyase family enzyme
MKIEHIGICVSVPIAMGNWYKEHLGADILFHAGNDEDGVSFVTDGHSVIEFGRLPEGPPLDPRAFVSPLQLHIAFECSNPRSEGERLIAAGAEWIGESPRNDEQGEKVLLKDPWGYTIQLVNRKKKINTLCG